MVEWRQRADWEAAPPLGPGRQLRAENVRGICFHWPGHTKPIERDGIPASLRGWQRYHQLDRGWRDFAYNLSVDQWGRAWAGRGLYLTSSANGNARLNAEYLAVLLIVGQGERLSPQLISATRTAVDYIRAHWPSAKRLVGHGEVRPGGTECPGRNVRDALTQGLFGYDVGS